MRAALLALAVAFLFTATLSGCGVKNEPTAPSGKQVSKDRKSAD
ncbi:hypothetical protein [Oceanibacterium hippocampi]|uniref:Small periplasmic lipoprotein n=1 Tax=Oceanibacterium hippocampi TaxID=745714 RepID=A0A1Y5RXN5_9PROT|nr:hypothetical protein [Oceanibacterium hippocampi]SLN26563.1 hypothetical protein OCH7691_00827 [Oceanibacterium hippocampi]